MRWLDSITDSVSSVAHSYPTLQRHGLPHTRLPCQSATPEGCSNSCPSSRWCHPTISSSAVPFSSCLQSFPESGSFPMSRFFASGGQSIGVSTSTSDLPMNIQDWFPLDWLDLSAGSPWGSQESSPTPQFKIINLSVLSLFMIQLSHPYMTTGKP